MARQGDGRPPRLALALIAILLVTLFVLAPVCFLAGLVVMLVGHPLIGLLVLAAAVAIGLGALFAGVTTALGAVRAAGEGAVFRLGRLQSPAGESARPEDLRRVDPDHDYIRGDYTRHDDE